LAQCVLDDRSRALLDEFRREYLATAKTEECDHGRSLFDSRGQG
jgi:hypothetical protein